MLIQQIGFICMIVFKGSIAIYLLTIVVFVSSGVIFSTQKRHQMYLSVKNKEMLVYSLMVLPSLSYKSFEAMLVSELIIHFHKRQNIIWIVFICITTVPITIIILYKDWLIGEKEEEKEKSLHKNFHTENIKNKKLQ